MTTEEMEWSDYGRYHGARVRCCWFLLLFPLAVTDYYVVKGAILVTIWTLRAVWRV